MNTSLYRIHRTGNGFKERLQVRKFRDRTLMHEFLNTGDNAFHWYEVKATMPTKAGTYAFAGGQWHNVKSLDASILAHI